MRKPYIYQIFYDDKTHALINPEFLALDNRNNLRPDWFEFWVILSFLRQNELERNRLYGFLSPNFTLKTGLNSNSVYSLINSADLSTDVVLLCPNGWDQTCYFLNSWEQGEAWHPGIQAISQEILNECQILYDTKNNVANSYSSVFSNFFVAKKEFWVMWLDLAERFFKFMENDKSPQYLVNIETTYRNTKYPMKAFLQERLVEIVLNQNDFKVVRAGGPDSSPIYESIFKDSEDTRFLLNSCDEFKGLYRKTAQSKYLGMYWESRKKIYYRAPNINSTPNIKVTYSPSFFKRQ
jgi:hypothetical protein